MLGTYSQVQCYSTCSRRTRAFLRAQLARHRRQRNLFLCALHDALSEVNMENASLQTKAKIHLPADIIPLLFLLPKRGTSAAEQIKRWRTHDAFWVCNCSRVRESAQGYVFLSYWNFISSRNSAVFFSEMPSWSRVQFGGYVLRYHERPDVPGNSSPVEGFLCAIPKSRFPSSSSRYRQQKQRLEYPRYCGRDGRHRIPHAGPCHKYQ
jgi:hypothetical protein